VAIVHSNYHGSGRKGLSLSETTLHELSELYDGIAVISKISQLGLKNRRSYGHTVGSHRPEAMISENGDTDLLGGGSPIG
jgi:hypothetical protein